MTFKRGYRSAGGIIKNIFITGGSGFIAPHLLRVLDPACIVTMHVRDPEKITSVMAASAKSHPESRVFSGALILSEAAGRIPDACDTVIHLAGAVHGPSIEAVLDSNVTTTRNVLEIMQDRGIPNLIFMSTAAVWSDTEGRMLSESTPTNPQTLYGYAKLSAERLITDSVGQGRIASAVILRCNNTYGPGGFQGVVASFVRHLLRGQPIQIEGDGLQMREPLYVSDTVRAIAKAASAGEGLHVYGISGPGVVTVLGIAETIAKVLHRKLEIEWKPPNPDRARHIIMDVTKARRELGWVPHIGFEEGCRMYLEGR